jgi:hypothetical protein
MKIREPQNAPHEVASLPPNLSFIGRTTSSYLSFVGFEERLQVVSQGFRTFVAVTGQLRQAFFTNVSQGRWHTAT